EHVLLPTMLMGEKPSLPERSLKRTFYLEMLNILGSFKRTRRVRCAVLSAVVGQIQAPEKVAFAGAGVSITRVLSLS
ncbi:hypothetical protein, partial [Corallococcus exiguus]|uniref:hypothetical protein n=1 Tax=Corallococcus exiguus TaxID=83462 RepID=UPI001B8BE362